MAGTSKVVAKDKAILVDYEWISNNLLTVEWEYMVPYEARSAVVEVEYQPAEPDVGIGAGCNVYGDIPIEIEDKVAEIAISKWTDDMYRDIPEDFE